LGALLGVLPLACGGPGDGGGGGGPARVDIGLPVPAYRSTTVAGDSVSLEALRGKVVLLNVWATWCHPCREEMPELRAILARYESRGLELIGVSVDSDGARDLVREFMTEFEMTFPVWLDPSERISTQFLLVGVPTTFLIDRDGVLRWRKTGPIRHGDAALAAAIERALEGA
jgi:cytochrome c biogenesis protein CcmG, thiol:disulfide interchange protein DsbE